MSQHDSDLNALKVACLNKAPFLFIWRKCLYIKAEWPAVMKRSGPAYEAENKVMALAFLMDTLMSGCWGLMRGKRLPEQSSIYADKLDGLGGSGKRKREDMAGLDHFLQLPDDYATRTSEPGKKRVIWHAVLQSWCFAHLQMCLINGEATRTYWM